MLGQKNAAFHLLLATLTTCLMLFIAKAGLPDVHLCWLLVILSLVARRETQDGLKTNHAKVRCLASLIPAE